jgi:hypothetical protein
MPAKGHRPAPVAAATLLIIVHAAADTASATSAGSQVAAERGAANTAAAAVERETKHRPKTLHGGNYLARRGDFDPRPYDRVHLDDGLFLGRDHFLAKNRRWTDDGLAVGGYVSPNFQAGSESGSAHGIGEFLLTTSWEPLRMQNQRGRVLLGFAHDQTIGSLLTRTFADKQGLVETPNDLDTSPDKTFTTLGLLAWDHAFWTAEDAGWGYRAGQLFAAGFFALTGYLDDDRQFFMARPLAAAGGAQWVGANDIGLGAQLVGWRGGFYATGAVIDGSADRKFPDFNSLGDGRFLTVGEVGYERDLGGPHEMAIRLTWTHLDETVEDSTTKPSGESAIISLARKFHERWVLAARWSKSFRRLSADHRELYSFGLIRLQPFDYGGDAFGFGVFRGTPSDESRGTEYGAEVFYKLNIFQDISVMPDIQYWHRSDADGTEVRTVVYGVRVNFDY